MQFQSPSIQIVSNPEFTETGKSPKHALTLSDVQRIKQFMEQYSKKYGIPLPGRLPNHKDSKVNILPSDKNKADIHAEYQTAATEMHYRNISLSEFKNIGLEQCPNIVLMRPATDLCSKCQNFVYVLISDGNISDEEKSDVVSAYGAHLDRAKRLLQGTVSII